MTKNFLFTNVLGSFVFDENFKFLEKGEKTEEKKLAHKYSAVPLPKEKIKDVVYYFKKSENYSQFRNANIKATKTKVRQSVKEDLLIIQTIDTIEDLGKVANSLVKRVREWYELYCPEVSKEIDSHEKFLEIIMEKDRKELLAIFEINESESMGGTLSEEDLKTLKHLAKKIEQLFSEKKDLEEYLERLVKRCCPNVMTITGSLIGAKLVAHAGSLERLSEMPSSTIQLLGAEKALFRHVKTGARSPKHGLIVQHTLFTKIKSKDYGKLARLLADKISIAAKVDYFKGSPIGEKLRKDIEKKVGLMINS